MTQISAIHFERQYRDGEQERVEIVVQPLINGRPKVNITYSHSGGAP